MKKLPFHKKSLWRLLIHLCALGAQLANAEPQGGKVVSGSGQISTTENTTTVLQSTPTITLVWDKFNIAPKETVNFLQPSASSVAVNRIFDINGSQIMGQINANGQVFLINPNGILFGKDAVVNVGSLVASTLDLSYSGVSNSVRSFSGSGSGQLVNLGMINAAQGGYVALLGNKVSNQGFISAQLGTVVMGAGNAVTLNFNGNSLVNIQVDQSVLNSLVENGGMISANGGIVALSAGAKDSLLASVVNNTGTIEAHTMLNQNGVITLLGGMKAGVVNLSGKLDASAPISGNGGFVETSAARVNIASGAVVNTQAKSSIFGNWLVDPQDFTVAAIGGDISGATLSTNLGTTSVSLQSTYGKALGSGNINVNDTVIWNTNTSLNLTATNNVNINANIVASGNSAGLVISPNTGIGSEVASGTGKFKLAQGASITLPGDTPSLVISGTPYVVINRLGEAGSMTGTDLQGMQGGLGGHYALGSDLNATATASWNSNAGFNPIGQVTPFTGVFDGLGHSIFQLTINRPNMANVGMFSTADQFAEFRNIGLLAGSVVGAAGTGSLLGTAVSAIISDSYNTGTVKGNAGTGGLVGVVTTGDISNSYNTGTVSGNAGTGGLVGVFTTGNITNSYSTNVVTGAAGTGGLVGVITTGNLTSSYTSGNVTGAAGTGGLAGVMTTGNLSDAYATGNVVGAAGTGGLVGGLTTGFIRNSFATGTVVGAAGTGGLAGSSPAGSVVNSFAVSSGGAIDFSAWNYNGAWSTSASGIPVLGSLVKTITITALNDTKTYDGLAYYGNSGARYSSTDLSFLTGTLSFWGSSQGAINAGIYAITPGGLKTTNAQYVVTYVNGTLGINKAPLTLFASTDTKVYDGSTSSTGTVKVTGLVGTDSIIGASQSFESKNVLGIDGSTLKVNTGYVIKDGNFGGNYTVLTSDAVGTITRLNSVAWVGGTSGNWFDPLNWAGGAVPDLSNVANVVIPSGVNVSFNNSLAAPAQSGVVNVDSIASAGSLSLSAGNLNIAKQLNSDVLNQSGGVLGGAGSIAVNSLNQTGGVVSNAGNVVVKQAFTQSPNASIAVGGNVAISQALGNLDVNNVSGLVIDLSSDQGSVQLGNVKALSTLSVVASGNITQTASGSLISKLGSVITSQTGDIRLANLSNDQDGVIQLTGRNITLSDASDPNILLNATGNTTLQSGNGLSVSGTTQDLNIATSNGGNTTFGQTNVTGNLVTNSSGSVSTVGTVKVTGTASVVTATQDLSSILADKAATDAANAKANTDAADAKAMAEATTNAAKSISEIAAMRLANYFINTSIKGVPVTAKTIEAQEKITLDIDLSDRISYDIPPNSKIDAYIENILSAALSAKVVADSTGDQIVTEAYLTKSVADITASRVISDAIYAKTLANARALKNMADITAAIGTSTDQAQAGAIVDASIANDLVSIQAAQQIVSDAEQVARSIAKKAAEKIISKALAAKIIADAVAAKVVLDASGLNVLTKGETNNMALVASNAKSMVDASNAMITAFAIDAKRTADIEAIKIISNAEVAAKIITSAASDAHMFSRAIADYLIEQNILKK